MLTVRGVLIPQDRKEAPYGRMKQEEARLEAEAPTIISFVVTSNILISFLASRSALPAN